MGDGWWVNDVYDDFKDGRLRSVQMRTLPTPGNQADMDT